MFCQLQSACLQSLPTTTTTNANTRAEICKSTAHIKLLMATIRRMVLFSKSPHLATDLFTAKDAEIFHQRSLIKDFENGYFRHDIQNFKFDVKYFMFVFNYLLCLIFAMET
jgi:hypothetical protein